MKEKKLQVFVSSTYIDLKEERQAAVEAILSSGNIPAGMELFSAGDESQMNVIKRWIDESDIYMLILGGRYGSVEPKTGKSYTQLEYEYALEQNKPFFAVVLSKKFIGDKIKKIETEAIEQENPHKLKEFKDLVMSKVIRNCDDNKDIKIAVHETLSDFSYRKELTGWIRGDNTVNSSLLADEIARLTKENDELRKISSNSLQPLYNGLSYHDLKKLLENEKIQNDGFGVNGNLLDYLIVAGFALSNRFSSKNPNTRNNLLKLKNYKIVSYNSISEDFYFSEDGHNFYLKSLLEEKK